MKITRDAAIEHHRAALKLVGADDAGLEVISFRIGADGVRTLLTYKGETVFAPPSPDREPEERGFT